MSAGQARVKKEPVNNWGYLTELHYFAEVHLLVVINWF